eukprot:Phypoly_transcript_16631.p1 GENE.Phypoly_transcript_16631~~Phypoly_transcript_16631.p1  ORF type:complete len:208 (+),score=13.67 Phypoly_transcript_16631:88-711(+)
MEVRCHRFLGKTIATNNTYPRGVSGAKFIQGGVLVGYNHIPGWLFEHLMLNTRLNLRFRLRLKGIARDGSFSGTRDVKFTLLEGGANPCPVELLTTEEGTVVPCVEFMIDKIANATQSGFTTYKYCDFFWSAQLWDGDEMLDEVDSPINFKLVAVSNGANKTCRVSKKRKAEELEAITPNGFASYSSQAGLFPHIDMQDIRVSLTMG